MDKELIDVAKNLLDSVQTIFKKDAEFEDQDKNTEDGTYARSIYWELKNDPSRPNKPAKIILIKITREALKDYNTSTAEQQKAANKRFKGLIKAKYDTFDPKHDSTKFEAPPVEYWLITTKLLNDLC